jgi:hypothetical protein
MKPPAGCADQREVIVAYVMGEADAATSASVAAHLSDCAPCRAWAEQLRAEEQEVQDVFTKVAARVPRSVGRVPARCGGRPTSMIKPRSTSPTGGRRYRRAWWLPAVAAAGVLLVIGVWPGERGVTRAYGMSDVIAAVRSSTLHVRGEMFIPLNPPVGTDAVRTDWECWLDPAHGRLRQMTYWLHVKAEGSDVSIGERVIDGDYVMTVNHTEQWVEYARLDDFHRALERYHATNDIFTRLFGQRDESEKFVQIGEKEIGGVKYAVWQLEAEEPLIGVAGRVQCALNPRTGEIGEIHAWTKWRAQKEWQPSENLTLFERGIAIPDAVFDTTPPAGYTLKNTKETAIVPPLSIASDERNGLAYTQYISFKLPDGSVLLGWGSRDLESDASQEPLFAGLEFGGPLPELPIEYTALRQQYEDKEVVYTGRHVAYTQDADGFHEWSLYVAPEPNALPRWWNMHWVVHRFNVPDGRLTPLLFPNVSNLILIDGPQDFNDLVRGAMAELSESGQAPHGITYERVMQLARDVRTQNTHD